jgi:hypothetical protein
MFFALFSRSSKAETASQVLFDLKLQLTPLLEKSQHSIPSKTLPPMQALQYKLTSIGPHLYVYKDATFQIPNQ